MEDGKMKERGGEEEKREGEMGGREEENKGDKEGRVQGEEMKGERWRLRKGEVREGVRERD